MPRSILGQRVERAHLSFALAAHRALSPDLTQAVCWSPFSVAAALGMIASGARGDTRDELCAALLGEPTGSLADHSAMLTDAAALERQPGDPLPVLDVSNTLWVRRELPVRSEFVVRSASWPAGTVSEAPFADDPEAARRLINDSVSRLTRGLIRDVVPRAAVTTRTVLALVNALYLKTAWNHCFPARATAPAPFHGFDVTDDVPTMRLVARLGYAAVDGWRVVVLPALGAVDAVVLLPDASLADAEAALTPPTLARLLDAPTPTRVELFLPRLRVGAKADLREPLERLGIRAMFGPAAELTGISEAPLTVNAVLHEAVLTLDEQGLEGAAATATMTTLALVIDRLPPVVVRVDRPFLLLIRHRASGAVYFLARVVRPH